MQKESNRTEFARQHQYEQKKEKYALNLLKTHFPKTLDNLNKHSTETQCQCSQRDDGGNITHSKECQLLQDKDKKKLIKNYIDYKTEYNYGRDCSPDYYFARQIEKGIQFKKEKCRVKQQILKGKKYSDDQFY